MPEMDSSHRLYRILPIVAGIAGSIPAGFIHRGFGVGPYPSLIVGGVVALGLFGYGYRKMNQDSRKVRG